MSLNIALQLLLHLLLVWAINAISRWAVILSIRNLWLGYISFKTWQVRSRLKLNIFALSDWRQESHLVIDSIALSASSSWLYTDSHFVGKRSGEDWHWLGHQVVGALVGEHHCRNRPLFRFNWSHSLGLVDRRSWAELVRTKNEIILLMLLILAISQLTHCHTVLDTISRRIWW